MRRALRLTTAALALAWTGAVPAGAASLLVEDFSGGFDPAFNHSFSPVGTGTNVFWEIRTDLGAFPGNPALLLAPAEDDITFNLGVGERVDFASVTFAHCTASCITWHGTLGSVVASGGGSDLVKIVDTTGLAIGSITGITLAAAEAGFDDITISVVPEPSTLLLLTPGLAALALVRWRLALRRA